MKIQQFQSQFLLEKGPKIQDNQSNIFSKTLDSDNEQDEYDWDNQNENNKENNPEQTSNIQTKKLKQSSSLLALRKKAHNKYETKNLKQEKHLNSSEDRIKQAKNQQNQVSQNAKLDLSENYSKRIQNYVQDSHSIKFNQFKPQNIQIQSPSSSQSSSQIPMGYQNCFMQPENFITPTSKGTILGSYKSSDKIKVQDLLDKLKEQKCEDKPYEILNIPSQTNYLQIDLEKIKENDSELVGTTNRIQVDLADLQSYYTPDQQIADKKSPIKNNDQSISYCGTESDDLHFQEIDNEFSDNHGGCQQAYNSQQIRNTHYLDQQIRFFKKQTAPDNQNLENLKNQIDFNNEIQGINRLNLQNQNIQNGKTQQIQSQNNNIQQKQQQKISTSSQDSDFQQIEPSTAECRTEENTFIHKSKYFQDIYTPNTDTMNNSLIQKSFTDMQQYTSKDESNNNIILQRSIQDIEEFKSFQQNENLQMTRNSNNTSYLFKNITNENETLEISKSIDDNLFSQRHFNNTFTLQTQSGMSGQNSQLNSHRQYLGEFPTISSQQIFLGQNGQNLQEIMENYQIYSGESSQYASNYMKGSEIQSEDNQLIQSAYTSQYQKPSLPESLVEQSMQNSCQQFQEENNQIRQSVHNRDNLQNDLEFEQNSNENYEDQMVQNFSSLIQCSTQINSQANTWRQQLVGNHGSEDNSCVQSEVEYKIGRQQINEIYEAQSKQIESKQFSNSKQLNYIQEDQKKEDMEDYNQYKIQNQLDQHIEPLDIHESNLFNTESNLSNIQNQNIHYNTSEVPNQKSPTINQQQQDDSLEDLSRHIQDKAKQHKASNSSSDDKNQQQQQKNYERSASNKKLNQKQVISTVQNYIKFISPKNMVNSSSRHNMTDSQSFSTKRTQNDSSFTSGQRSSKLNSKNSKYQETITENQKNIKKFQSFKNSKVSFFASKTQQRQNSYNMINTEPDRQQNERNRSNSKNKGTQQKLYQLTVNPNHPSRKSFDKTKNKQ